MKTNNTNGAAKLSQPFWYMVILYGVVWTNKTGESRWSWHLLLGLYSQFMSKRLNLGWCCQSRTRQCHRQRPGRRLTGSRVRVHVRRSWWGGAHLKFSSRHMKLHVTNIWHVERAPKGSLIPHTWRPGGQIWRMPRKLWRFCYSVFLKQNHHNNSYYYDRAYSKVHKFTGNAARLQWPFFGTWSVGG